MTSESPGACRDRYQGPLSMALCSVEMVHRVDITQLCRIPIPVQFETSSKLADRGSDLQEPGSLLAGQWRGFTQITLTD